MKTVKLEQRNPSAYITQGKQRVAQNNNRVYLKGGDTFEIELYNPLPVKVSAEIYVNNNSLGQRIVLRPGERIFLERYLDDASKFKFETYTAYGDGETLSNNGVVTVSFYKEQVYSFNPPFYYQSGTRSNPYQAQPLLYVPDSTSPAVWCSSIQPGAKLTVTSNSSPQWVSTTVNTSIPDSPKETGRVEKGEYSQQKLVDDRSTAYEYFPFHSVEWHILPKSQQVLTAKAVRKQTAKYCTNCGARVRKDSYKFCPHCGTSVIE